MKIKIIICIVLYKKKIEHLEIKNIINIKNIGNFEIRMCVFDNSPEYNPNGNHIKNIEYYPQNKNQGIALPYNYSLEIANSWNAQYIILLDQDTIIEELFFSLLENPIKENCDIILPQIFHTNIHISPLRHNILSKKPLNIFKNNSPINYENIRILFINSGTTISVNFLNKINGFNSLFWLDMQDYWLSLMAFKYKAKVKILDYRIFHNLSVLNKEYISIERYKNIHTSTAVFNFRYENFNRKIVYLLFLILRYFKRINYLRKNKFLFEYWKLLFH